MPHLLDLIYFFSFVLLHQGYEPDSEVTKVSQGFAQEVGYIIIYLLDTVDSWSVCLPPD